VELYSRSEQRLLNQSEYSSQLDGNNLFVHAPRGDFLMAVFVDHDSDGRASGIYDFVWTNDVSLPVRYASLWLARIIPILEPVSSYQTYEAGTCSNLGLTVAAGGTKIAWEQFPERREVIDRQVVYVETWRCSDGTTAYVEESVPSQALTASVELPLDAAVSFGVDQLNSSIYGKEHYIGISYTYFSRSGGKYMGVGIRARTTGTSACKSPLSPELKTAYMAVPGESYAVSWSPSAAEGKYQLEEASETTFSTPARSLVTGTSMYFSHSPVETTAYYYRVRGIGTCGGTTEYSQWSNVATTVVGTGEDPGGWLTDGHDAQRTSRSSGNVGCSPQLLWSFPGTGASQPLTTARGHIVLPTESSGLLRLDGTGCEVWRAPRKASFYGGTIGPDGDAYAADTNGLFSRWSALTGVAVWSRQLDPGNNLVAPIVRSDGTVFWVSENARAYALDASTGQTIWENDLCSESGRHGCEQTWGLVLDSRGLLVSDVGDEVGDQLVFVDPGTGRVLETLDLGGGVWGVLISDASGAILASVNDTDVVCVMAGRIKWSRAVGFGVDSAALLPDGDLAVVTSDESGWLTKLDHQTGAVVWQRQFAGPAGVARVDNVTTDGQGRVIVAFESTTEDGQVPDSKMACYRGIDGADLWGFEYSYPEEGQHSVGDDGTIYGSGSINNVEGLHVFRCNPGCPPPTGPGGLHVAKDPMSGTYSVSWPETPGATHYRVFRNSAEIYSGPLLSLTDAEVNVREEPYYTVQALNECGAAPPVGCEPLTSPGSVSATALSWGSVLLEWDWIEGAGSYRIIVDGDSSPIYEGGELSFAHTGLAPGTRHCYAVIGMNACSASPASAEVCVTTPSRVRRRGVHASQAGGAAAGGGDEGVRGAERGPVTGQR
jgi:outer membrane protein assembly factor BamB